jgi:tryptophanyl-tRNA synthetase
MPYYPGKLRENTVQMFIDLLACGIDPLKSDIFIQSLVPQHSELNWILSCITPFGELSRMTQFKDKSDQLQLGQKSGFVSAGLFTYPVLQAADILIYKANYVPVGKDQEQHLEMTRRFARRFNMIYEVNYFPEPDAYNFGQDLIKIPGLDGTGKMGKSEGNGVFLADMPAEIRKKVMKAVTDTGPTGPDQEPSEPVKNLFTIMKVVSDPSTVKYFTDKHASGEIRYGDLKKQLAEDIVKVTEPIRIRINEILSDHTYLAKVVKEGGEKARESASRTIGEVREILGYKPF